MNKQKGFAPVLIVIGILVVMAVAGGAYYFGTKNGFLLPNPSSLPSVISPTIKSSLVSTTAKQNTTVDYRKEQISQANQQSQQNECFKKVNEISLSTCKSEIGWSSIEWDKLTEEEKKKEGLFWKCYDRVSLSESNKCSNQYLDVTKKRNAYFDCLASEVDVLKYCGGTTGYTQVNNFPKDKEALYWQCIEQTRTEKESKCSAETGYNPS